MKKTSILIIICVLCFFLIACDPGEYNFNKDDLSDTVVGIELINYNNTKQKTFFSWVPDHSSKLMPFELDNMTVIEKLDNENIPDFLEQLSNVTFLYKYYSFNSPKDICIRLIYSNNDFEIIWSNYPSFAGYVGSYDSNGNVMDFIGSFVDSGDFASLVNNFFETKIT